ncbi:MAG: ABC transporter permease, partial [Candidatus Binatia bacterium]
MTLLGDARGHLLLVGRQLWRSPRRTVLTFIGLLIAFFLYTSLESVLSALRGVLAQTSSETIIFLRPRNAMNFLTAELPRRYTAAVREMDGVVAATPMRFYFAKGRNDGTFVVALAVEVDSFMRTYRPTSVSEAELRATAAEPSAALVGRQVLEANQWHVGDRVTLRAIADMPALDLHIVGDIDGTDRLGGVVVFNLAYLDRLIGAEGWTTFIQARIQRPELAASIARALDERFASYSVPTETRTEKAHMTSVVAGFAEVLNGLQAVGLVTLFVTLLVVANAVAMSVRERTVEIGTLRALGFGRARVMGLIIGESILVSILGGLAGTAAAYLLFASGILQLPGGASMRLAADLTVLVRAAALSVPLGAIAGLQPAWSAVRI